MATVMKKSSTKVTKVFVEEFNGRPMFSIWQVDPAGNKMGERPIINFGQTKAEFILRHMEELEDFLELI